MPVYNVTVDDSSPMFAFSSGWVDNPSDAQLLEYYERTSHATNRQGATVSVTFFGNDVYLYGGTRPGYGPFNVTLDGQTTSHNVIPAANTTTQNLLFASTGLSSNTHTLILTNAGNGTFVDVDFIIFTTGDGDSRFGPTYTNIDDSSPLITYSPSDFEWQTTSLNPSLYFNSTLHSSNLQGAQATVPFNGNAVAVYGATDQSHGEFTVNIDDQPPVLLDGSAPVFRARTLLYWAGGLQHGNHTVTITNAHNLLLMDLDSVTTTSWSPPQTPENHLSTSRTAMIVGMVSGACVLFAWIVTLLLVLRGRRMRRRQGRFEEAKLHHLSLRADASSHELRKLSSGKGADLLPTRLPSTASARSGTESTGDGLPTDGTVSAPSHPNRHSSTLSSIFSISTSRSQLLADQSRRERMSFGKLLSTTRDAPRRMVASNRLHDLENRRLDDDEIDSKSDEGPPDYTETTQPTPRQPMPVRLL